MRQGMATLITDTNKPVRLASDIHLRPTLGYKNKYHGSEFPINIDAVCQEVLDNTFGTPNADVEYSRIAAKILCL